MIKPLIFIFTIFLSLNNIYSQDGSLDYSFGSSGKVITDFGLTNEYGYDLAIQSDGKIIVVGKTYAGTNYDVAIARYNTNGTLDNTFGYGGLIVKNLQNYDDIGQAVILQPDGKILIAGTTFNGSFIRDFCLLRYNSNGTPDNSFGVNGVVIADIGNIFEYATCLDLQTDGKIIVGGYSANNLNNTDFAIVRFNPDGSIDNGFGNNGIIKTSIGSGNDDLYSIKIQSDGKILAAGTTNNGTFDFCLVRYNSDGSLDNSFGNNGIVITDFDNRYDRATSIQIQPDGKILVGGIAEITNGNMDFACVRYNTNGTLDNTFGSGGKVTKNIMTVNDYCYKLVLQNDGKIILSGYSDNAYALFRIYPDGSTDYSFGGGSGMVYTPFSATHTEPNSCQIQSDGKIVVAGSGYTGYFPPYTWNFTLVRYENATPLPVELKQLNGFIINGKVELHWQTETEVNNYGFEIERNVRKASSFSGIWEKIGFVKGSGNSNSPKDYTFTDENPPSGKLKYRLKQIDNDGSFSYSPEIEIEIEVPHKFELYQNYPNPFSVNGENTGTTISWQSPVSNWQTIKLYNSLGEEIETIVDGYYEAGKHSTFYIINSTLPSGVYFYQLRVTDPSTGSVIYRDTKKMILSK